MISYEMDSNRFSYIGFFFYSSQQVTAVLGTDFPLQYFSWFIDNVYPSCSASEYR